MKKKQGLEGQGWQGYHFALRENRGPSNPCFWGGGGPKEKKITRKKQGFPFLSNPPQNPWK